MGTLGYTPSDYWRGWGSTTSSGFGAGTGDADETGWLCGSVTMQDANNKGADRNVRIHRLDCAIVVHMH